MRTMVVDVSVPRIVLTRALGRLTPRAYFTPISPLRIAELPEPPLPAPNWVRVHNRLCGICGSDLHQVFLDTGLDVAPLALPAHRRIYLGHEMVGQVTEVGPEAGGIQLGDRVVRWGRADDCLARGRIDLCPACSRGHRVLCQVASEPRTHEPVGGGFGDSFITPASTLVLVRHDLTDEQAIFTEPVAVAIHAAWRRIPEPQERILVLGCGTIGFLLIQVLRALQPGCLITALAEFPWQGDLARQLGADEIILVGEDGYARAAQVTGGRLYRGRGDNRMLMGGFDVVWDVVGVAGTVNKALRWARAGGTVVLVGVNLHRMAVDLTPVWYQEVDFIGAVGHDVITWQGERVSTFDLAMRWMAEGLIRVDRLLSHRFPLSAYRQALLTAVDKHHTRAIKVALDCSDSEESQVSHRSRS